MARARGRALGERIRQKGLRMAGSGIVTPNTTPVPAVKSKPIQQGKISELEVVLLNRLERAGLPAPEQQFRFCLTRRWRADMAYPDAMLLIEADGGTWVGGRHTRGKGFENDCEKTSTAAAMGYRVIRVTRSMIEDGRAVELIRRALVVTSQLMPAQSAALAHLETVHTVDARIVKPSDWFRLSREV